MKSRTKLLILVSVFAIAISLVVSLNRRKELIESDSNGSTISSESLDVSSSSSVPDENETSSYTIEKSSTKVIGFHPLPEDIMNEVYVWQQIYPNMDIGVGIYSLDGESGYQYNEDCYINSACTIKAAYAMYVLKKCEADNIDIWNTFLTYEERHYDPDGSGQIVLYANFGQQYCIGDLIYYLLRVSDNAAYSMLLEMFPLNDFYIENSKIGGENDGQKWGKATVQQRKNEWLEVYNYANSNSGYSNVLLNNMCGTPYAYLLNSMKDYHYYLHKSGWSDSYTYPSAGDCAIIDDQYLIIVLTQDYSTGSGHIDCVEAIGRAAENYCDMRRGEMF